MTETCEAPAPSGAGGKPSEVDRQLRQAAELAVDLGLIREVARSRFDYYLLVAALRAERGNQCRAALRMGVHRNTLARACEDSGISKDDRWAVRQARPTAANLKYVRRPLASKER